MLVDQIGMEWEDPEQGDQLCNYVQKRIDKITKSNDKYKSQLEKDKLSKAMKNRKEKKIAENNEKLDLLETSLSDIKAIDNSSDVFRLVKPKSDNGYHNVTQTQDEVIEIEGSSKGMWIHEIRHIGQLLNNGNLSFINGKLQNSNKDNEGRINNEINAYLTQFAFDGTYPGWANSLKDINKKSLFNIRNSSGSYVYDFLNKDKK